jgi:uncharacterized iron-regulated membrane protein
MNRIHLRTVWLQLHLWLGLTLGVLGALVALSGSVLVYDHAIDAWLNPQRYAVSGVQAALPYGAYLERASAALEGRARAVNLRMPEEEGMPLVVIARAREGSGFYRVYLDPPTGKVLEVSQGGGLVGWMHSFHENLQLRDYAGREIVGAVGIAMLISSLSGLYLWWPARGRFREALGLRRGFSPSRNLHYLFGFYGAIVLGMLAFTGIFLAYPDAGRAAVGAVSTVSPGVRNVQSAAVGSGGRMLTADQAVRIAQAHYPAAAVSGIGLPAGARGAFRVNFRYGASAAPVNSAMVFLDPASGEVLRLVDPARRSAGDGFLVMQRLMHSGEAFGSLGRAVIFLVGLLPALFAVTGTMMWLKKRRRRARLPSASGALASQE